MPYSDFSEFPRGIFSTDVLTDSALLVKATDIKVVHMVIGTGTALETIIFRAVDDSPEYFRIVCPANRMTQVGGFDTSRIDPGGGLEVLTLSAAGNVSLAIFYVD